MSTSSNLLKIRTGGVIIYSIIILASATPSFSDISNSLRIVYYLLVPGYVLTLYLNEDYSVIERLALSFMLGLMAVLVIYSFNNNEQITATALAYDLIIPAVSIILVVVDYYRRTIRLI